MPFIFQVPWLIAIFDLVSKTKLNYGLFLLYVAPPRVQLAPGPTHAKTGQNLTLPQCKVTGFPSPAVTWRKLTGVLSRNRAIQQKGTLTIIATETTDTGPYQCTARNNLGQVTAITSIFVWSPPKFTKKPPSRVVKLIGQNLSLICFATAQTQASISWRRVGGVWEDGRMEEQDGTLKITALKKSDSGTYVCEVKQPLNTIEARSYLEG